MVTQTQRAQPSDAPFGLCCGEDEGEAEYEKRKTPSPLQSRGQVCASPGLSLGSVDSVMFSRLLVVKVTPSYVLL